MIFKSINKTNSFIALLILGTGFWLLSSKLYPPITMYCLFLAGIISISVLKLNFSDLFKPLKKRDIGTILIGLISSLTLAILSSFLLKHLHVNIADNPIHKELTPEFTTVATRLLKIIPQLLGEELITILPFLMIVRFFASKGSSEKKAGMIALIITSIVFGLLHLSTYNWNILQCLLIISLARIPFTLSYIKSKNIIVPWIIHVMYDWTTFIIGIIPVVAK